MNIKLKLAFQFTLLVSIILLFFAAMVYYFYYESQLGKFRENITDSAKNNAILLINVVEVDSALLKKIKQSTSSWEDEEIVITDPDYHIIYSNNQDYLSEKVMREHKTSGQVSYFTILKKDGVFYRHVYKGHTYFVYSMAYDKSRHFNLAELRRTLIWSIIISIILSVYISYLFSRRAIWPISKLIYSIKTINSSKLNDRLDEGNKKDEIAQLAITFNEMLTDLEIAFKNQEDFVSNASHELRTPLTLMLLESDYLLSREHTKDEYRAHILAHIEDIKQLNSLLNSLLELAHLNKDNDIQFSEVRIDEIVFDSIQKIKAKFEGRKIVPKIEYPENESGLIVSGNPGLLSIAFNNLIENACKFSDSDVLIEFTLTEQLVKIVISDRGIGIPVGQMEEIFKPFRRGSNVKFKGGFGIGLSLVAKIFQIHHVPVNVVSRENEGTKIEIEFKVSK